MGGLSIGVFWGSVVSAVGLAALSLSSPLPPRGDDTGQAGAADAPVVVAEETAVVPAAAEAEAVAPEAEAAPEPVVEEMPEATPEAAPRATPAQDSAPATEVPLPSGSEFNRPPPEPEAALPVPDAAPSSAAPQAPALASDGAAPSLDTAPAAQPAVDAVAPATITAEATDAEAPASPAAAPAPSVASGPAALSEPAASETPQVSTALLPQVAEDAPEADAEPEALATPALPTVGDAADPEGDAPQEAAASTLPSVPGASGLPTVAPLIAPLEPEGEAEPEAEIEEEIAELPAIQAFATPFDEGETRPLMAVVLIDDPESRIDLETLTRFSFPVAFAVDPLNPDAEARAAAYRAAGFEVVVLGSMIAEGATAVDTEVALAAALQTLPEAVAVIDTPEGRIQGDRPVLDATVAALAESGHGLLAFPRGLNAAEQTAARAGVPGATVFRFLDGEDQRATVITRFLSRAAFAAAQEGTVIVVGRTRPDTVTALFSWALGGRTEAVALAPLSATMLRAAE